MKMKTNKMKNEISNLSDHLRQHHQCFVCLFFVCTLVSYKPFLCNGRELLRAVLCLCVRRLIVLGEGRKYRWNDFFFHISLYISFRCLFSDVFCICCFLFLVLRKAFIVNMAPTSVVAFVCSSDGLIWATHCTVK